MQTKYRFWWYIVLFECVSPRLTSTHSLFPCRPDVLSLSQKHSKHTYTHTPRLPLFCNLLCMRPEIYILMKWNRNKTHRNIIMESGKTNMLLNLLASTPKHVQSESYACKFEYVILLSLSKYDKDKRRDSPSHSLHLSNSLTLSSISVYFTISLMQSLSISL